MGKIVIPDAGFEDREITLSPVSANSSLLKVEIKISDSETTYVTGNFTLRVNPLNHGQLTFPTYTGGLGHVTDVPCSAGLLASSRVTTITGTVTTTGVESSPGILKKLNFTARTGARQCQRCHDQQSGQRERARAAAAGQRELGAVSAGGDAAGLGGRRPGATYASDLALSSVTG